MILFKNITAICARCGAEFTYRRALLLGRRDHCARCEAQAHHDAGADDVFSNGSRQFTVSDGKSRGGSTWTVR